MGEGDDVLEHFNRLKTLAEQLDAVGAPVSENEVVITLLASLSESHQLLITALESRADSVSWEVVMSQLLHEDMNHRRKVAESKKPRMVKTNLFMSRDTKNKPRPAKKTGPCHNCGNRGHWIAKCPSRN